MHWKLRLVKGSRADLNVVESGHAHEKFNFWQLQIHSYPPLLTPPVPTRGKCVPPRPPLLMLRAFPPFPLSERWREASSQQRGWHGRALCRNAARACALRPGALAPGARVREGTGTGFRATLDVLCVDRQAHPGRPDYLAYPSSAGGRLLRPVLGSCWALRVLPQAVFRPTAFWPPPLPVPARSGLEPGFSRTGFRAARASPFASFLSRAGLAPSAPQGSRRCVLHAGCGKSRSHTRVTLSSGVGRRRPMFTRRAQGGHVLATCSHVLVTGVRVPPTCSHVIGLFHGTSDVQAGHWLAHVT